MIKVYVLNFMETIKWTIGQVIAYNANLLRPRRLKSIGLVINDKRS